MEHFDRKQHWENIYKTKGLHEVSWYQPSPETSLNFIRQFNLPKHARIIDVGGGDSFLVDNLLELGYSNVTVLDISEAAIKRAQKRLGPEADRVNWICADAADFVPEEQYDFWHDRAAFHFLTDEKEIDNYLKTAGEFVSPNGFLVIGTFAKGGPTKCSGIEVRQYSENSMSERLKAFFEKLVCISTEHLTPFDTIQNFVFCSFRKLQSTT